MTKEESERILADARLRLQGMVPAAVKALKEVAAQTKDKASAKKAKALLKKYGLDNE